MWPLLFSLLAIFAASLQALQLSLPDEVLNLVNQARSTVGCSPLQIDYRLVNAAQQYANCMASFKQSYDLCGSGSQWIDRVRNSGYSFSRVGEAVAVGETVSGAVNLWMEKERRGKVLLDCGFIHTGVAVARDNEGMLYWVQYFGVLR